MVPIASRVALAAGLTAVMALVAPGWCDPGWASATQGHHAAKPTKGVLIGKVVRKLQWLLQRDVQADVAAVGQS